MKYGERLDAGFTVVRKRQKWRVAPRPEPIPRESMANQVCGMAGDVDEALGLWLVKMSAIANRAAMLMPGDEVVAKFRDEVCSGTVMPLCNYLKHER